MPRGLLAVPGAKSTRRTTGRAAPPSARNTCLDRHFAIFRLRRLTGY
jgi:hypothetical protein